MIVTSVAAGWSYRQKAGELRCRERIRCVTGNGRRQESNGGTVPSPAPKNRSVPCRAATDGCMGEAGRRLAGGDEANDPCGAVGRLMPPAAASRLMQFVGVRLVAVGIASLMADAYMSCASMRKGRRFIGRNCSLVFSSKARTYCESPHSMEGGQGSALASMPG